MALCWHSTQNEASGPQRPFLALARLLHAVTNDVYCEESCRRHSCGCPHSERYDFDWEPPDELAERLCRKFGRRSSIVWTREHNTKAGGPGRLHLNVLWDENWVDQEWLSEAAEACGFGNVVHISRVRDTDGLIVAGEGRGQRIARYATKCLKYASKDLHRG